MISSVTYPLHMVGMPFDISLTNLYTGMVGILAHLTECPNCGVMFATSSSAIIHSQRQCVDCSNFCTYQPGEDLVLSAHINSKSSNMSTFLCIFLSLVI